MKFYSQFIDEGIIPALNWSSFSSARFLTSEVIMNLHVYSMIIHCGLVKL